MRGEKLRVWFALEDMQGGQKLIEQIDRAIQVNDRLLLVLSEHSMNSEWVRREIKRARATERVENRQKLFPIRRRASTASATGAAMTPIPAKTSPRRFANTTSPTSRTGKTTTPSKPPSPTCAAICELRRNIPGIRREPHVAIAGCIRDPGPRQRRWSWIRLSGILARLRQAPAKLER